MDFVAPFSKINKSDSNIAGGKGASLGEMVQAGIPVPAGFVVLVNAFHAFLAETRLNVKIAGQIEKIDYKDSNSIYRISAAITDLICNAKIPADLNAIILNEFNKLRTDYVAVRSSATAEDSLTASWAGELETLLNTDKKNLMQNIKKCWASLFSPRALFYAYEKKLIAVGDAAVNKGAISNYPISVAVVVQKMIDSEVSGICFTVNSINKDKNQMVIEAGWGLGEAIVSGQVTPDNYIISKSEELILEVNVNAQKKMIIRSKNGIKNAKVPKEKINSQKLTGRQIIELAKLCKKIENHYKFPQDIEWAFSKNKFHIIQSRPITVM